MCIQVCRKTKFRYAIDDVKESFHSSCGYPEVNARRLEALNNRPELLTGSRLAFFHTEIDMELFRSTSVIIIITINLQNFAHNQLSVFVLTCPHSSRAQETLNRNVSGWPGRAQSCRRFVLRKTSTQCKFCDRFCPPP